MACREMESICFADARDRHLLVALSGGADSVALLCLLLRRQIPDRLTITAAHYHHGIRGAQADADAQFCRQLCSRLQVRLIEARGDVPGLACQRGMGLESAAREARYAFLHRARAQCGADWIALAHHMDDQAETILMHLFRGTGLEGACGMARIAGVLYRPLLDFRKSQLMQFLESNGISWREDASNGVPDNPRNFLRLNVLPEIEKSYPSAVEAIARFARLAQPENQYLVQLCARFLEARLEHGPWGRRLRLSGEEDAFLLRRALRAICGNGIGSRKIDELLLLCRQSRGKLDIGDGLRAERSPQWLYFLRGAPKKNAQVPLQIPGETALEGLCRIQAEIGNFSMEPDCRQTELADAASLTGAVLRTRRSGDRFHPLGAPGDRLLSDYLTDRKLDRPLRDYQPLLARGNRVLWVCGLGMSEHMRVTDHTRRIVRLSMYPITEEKAEVDYDK